MCCEDFYIDQLEDLCCRRAHMEADICEQWTEWEEQSYDDHLDGGPIKVNNSLVFLFKYLSPGEMQQVDQLTLYYPKH